ncbi:hypothetical protein TIFTF001_025506 [Ficus carica]|uniref:Protein kinase domain-containing protein n=1 Tax=Ficus carica TaxID=3494 RepID=A0AA88ANV3_FICCA|nr:hypothetical protein TIFTF001_025506 [Ficus carica]
MAVVMIICTITTKFQCRPAFLMSLLYVFIILSIFFSSTESLNFSFTSFTPGDTRISCERRASVDSKNRTIELISDILSLVSVGRATYFEPFQLWDEVSGSLSDFNTRFSFTIDSQGNPLHGDGLAFFLAPAGSKLNLNTRGGAGLGLTWDNDYVNNTHGDPFVAVEFDIFPNFPFDVPFEHVGINVNSMLSVATTRWWYTLHEEKPNEAWISYNSSSKQLSVLFTGWNDSVLLEYRLSCEVDLKTVLPPCVTVGFSASTGSFTALHSTYSWEFNSTSHMIKKRNSLDHTKTSILLIVGLGIGGEFVILIAGFALSFLFLRKMIQRRNEYVTDFEKGTGPRKFSYHDFKRATNNFNLEAKLGEGGFGSVYKGFLRELNSSVAVKKLSEESKQGLQEFASEVKVISQLRHRNLVKLIGWCHKKSKLLLVYEYMPNGSLDRHLLNATDLLIWEIRYKIVQG